MIRKQPARVQNPRKLKGMVSQFRKKVQQYNTP